MNHQETMTLLNPLQLLFFILLILPFAVSIPIGYPLPGLWNNKPLGLESSLPLLGGCGATQSKRGFAKVGVPRSLPIATVNVKANVLSKKETNPVIEFGEYVTGVDTQDRAQSARRNLESLVPPCQSLLWLY